MNQLTTVNQNQDLVSQFTPDQIKLITTTIAKGATADELQLFLYRCNLLKLNPFKPGQIHFIKYGQGPGTIVVGIEGFRSSAARTGKHVSTTRGVHKDELGNITQGWCKVIRRDSKGEAQEYYEETPMAEYYNDRNPSWKKMPETMIKKCSEAAALRMAYPDDLGGIYIDEEKDAILKTAGVDEDKKVLTPWIEQPNADDGDQTPQEDKPYIIPFGTFQKRTIPEAMRVFGIEKLKNAVVLTEERIVENKPYANSTIEMMQDFADRISRAIADFENGEIHE